jgi:hypothetical protein
MLSRTHAAAIVATATTISLAMPATAYAGDGMAAGRQTMQLDCAGVGTVTIETTPAVVQDSWSAAQLVGGGHFVPVAFRYVAYDETAGLALDDETVTHPAAHNKQATTTCSTSRTAQLGDIVPADAPLPSDVKATDTVRLSFIATVITRP